MKLFIDADSIMFKAACTQDTKYDTRVVTRKIIEDAIADCFADETYIAVKGKFELMNYALSSSEDSDGNTSDEITITLKKDNDETNIQGTGGGPIEAFVSAVNNHFLSLIHI